MKLHSGNIQWRMNNPFFIVLSCISLSLARAGEPPQQKGTMKPEIFPQMGHVSTGFTSKLVGCFTSDGKHIITAYGNGSIILWERETGKEVRHYYGLSDRISSVVLSHDGRYLAGSDESYYTDNVIVWETETGVIVRSFRVRASGVAPSIATFSVDDKTLFVSGSEELNAWDIASGTRRQAFRTNLSEGEELFISALAVTGDGRYLLSSSNSESGTQDETDTQKPVKHITVWDIASGKKVREFCNHRVNAIAITPDQQYVISAFYEDSVRIWNFATGKQLKTLEYNETESLALTRDGNVLSVGRCENILVVDWKKGTLRKKITDHISDWVKSVAFSPDGQYVLAGGQSNTPKLYNVATGTLVQSFGGYLQTVEAASVSINGKLLLTGQAANFVNLWDMTSGIQIKTIQHTMGMTSVAFSPNGQTIAAGGYDFKERVPTIRCWNLQTFKETAIIRDAGESMWARHITFSADGKKVFHTVYNKLTASEYPSGKKLLQITTGDGELTDVFLSRDGSVALLDYQRSPELWDVNKKKMIKRFKDCIGIMNTEGTTALIWDLNTLGFQLWNIRQNKLLRPLKLRIESLAGSNIYFASISDDSKYALLYTDKNILYLLDLSNGTIVRTMAGHTNHITLAGFTIDGQRIYSSSTDGTTRLWNLTTGKELAQFIAFTNGEWIVMTPEGYFNASVDGAHYLNVRLGNTVYSIDNFYEKYYNPVAVANALQGKSQTLSADIRRETLPPPEVKILSPATGTTRSSDTITITVYAKDMGGGINEIRLYQNERVVSEETRGFKAVPKGKERISNFLVTLVDGVNTFRVVAFNNNRTESNPAECKITLTAQKQEADLHIVAAGINVYKNPALNLNYAEPDARGIADFFKSNNTRLFAHVNIAAVYNEQATKNGIIAKLSELEHTNPQDVVIVYLAGHGENLNDTWYFIPYELTYPEREEEIAAKALSSEKLKACIKKIPAQKILVLIDACKSGAALVAFRGFEDRKALAQLSRATGIHIVAASNNNQFAAEVKELGHGVFTYTLLEGLHGNGATKGETITVRKLMSYIEEQLPELTKKYKQEAQYPVVDSRGMDFPIVIVK